MPFAGCGASYHQDSGAFSFPAVPGQNYPDGQSCAWVIQVTAGKVKHISIDVMFLTYSPLFLHAKRQVSAIFLGFVLWKALF